MKKITAITLLLLVGMNMIFGQNRQNAIMYSQTGSFGTALSQSMGGAVGAMGGDFSSASVNPAGLGLFRSSEMAISPNLFNYSMSSKFYGHANDDSKFNFNISNMHMVLHFPSANQMKTKGWLSTTFGIGFNRTMNLNQRMSISGVNTDGSIVNAAANAANGKSPTNLDPFSTGLFWDAYLIDTISGGSKTYTSNLGMKNGGATQRMNLESTGRTGETDISFAGNYSNRLYVGGSLAIRRIVYEQSISHSETNETDSVSSFTSLNYNTNFFDKGTSVALRAGAIYRINDWFRAGLSAMIPIDYTVNRSYDADIHSNTAAGSHDVQSPDGSTTYKISQSPRITASGAFIINKQGIISVDYETVNYAATRLRDDQGSFDKENEQIRETYRATGNLRIGAELRFEENYVRAGYQLLSSPFISQNNAKNMQIYSFGAGYRGTDFYLDAAYLIGSQKGSFSPYNPALAFTQLAETKALRHSLIVTVGTRF